MWGCGETEVGWSRSNQTQKTHLAGTGLGEVRDDEDLLGGRERSDDFADLEGELLGEGGFVVGVVGELASRAFRLNVKLSTGGGRRSLRFEGNERVDGLARELVCGTDDGCLSNTLVQDECGLDLCCRETVSRDIDNIW